MTPTTLRFSWQDVSVEKTATGFSYEIYLGTTVAGTLLSSGTLAAARSVSTPDLTVARGANAFTFRVRTLAGTRQSTPSVLVLRRPPPPPELGCNGAAAAHIPECRDQLHG